mmetsp:Transcript_20854/g.58091  ORF Transcript_20854/g.58091 Transcript_20854/m.58091 type:complete len:202 (-) Transcript_20854:395-1000(-)
MFLEAGKVDHACAAPVAFQWRPQKRMRLSLVTSNMPMLAQLPLNLIEGDEKGRGEALEMVLLFHVHATEVLGDHMEVELAAAGYRVEAQAEHQALLLWVLLLLALPHVLQGHVAHVLQEGKVLGLQVLHTVQARLTRNHQRMVMAFGIDVTYSYAQVIHMNIFLLSPVDLAGVLCHVVQGLLIVIPNTVGSGGLRGYWRLL